MRHRCKQKGEKVEVKHDNRTRELQNKTGNKKKKIKRWQSVEFGAVWAHNTLSVYRGEADVNKTEISAVQRRVAV